MLSKRNIAVEAGYFFTAMTFLTRIPVSRFSINDEHSLLKSSVYFPLVGVVVGLVIGSIFIIASHLWDTHIAVIICLAAGVGLTGAFHEDGFADVCDSMGAFDKDKKLAIMKDSRLGTYGVAGLICLFLLKFYSLVSIAQTQQNLLTVFVIAHCLSRWSSLPLIYLNPYVSRHSKAGKDLIADATNKNRLLIASLFTLLVLITCGSGDTLWMILGSLLVLALSQYYFRKSFGGITGDCLGATNQLTELMVFLVFALQ